MELERLVAALTRRWWIIALFGLIGALIGQFAEDARSDVFTGTAQIALAPDLDVFGSETVLNRLAINEIGTIGSAELRESVLTELGEDGEVLDGENSFSVQQVPDTDLVNLSVSGPDADLAVRAANVWANTYVDATLVQERGTLESRLAQINTDLQTARSRRLILDTALRETVVIREEGLVATSNESLLREPRLWNDLTLIDQDIDSLVQQRSNAQVELGFILDTSVVSEAVGPIDPTRTGNGLGIFEGLLIGLSAAVALVALSTRDRVSHRAVDQFSPSVWPTPVKVARRSFAAPWRARKTKRDISSIGTQVLTRLPETRLQVVAFAGVDRERTQHLKTALAEDFESRGYSVSLLGDDTYETKSRTVDEILSLLNAEESVIFADHDELRSKRFNGRIVTVVAIDEHRDREGLVAQKISQSLETSDSVLTVVAK